MKVESLGSANQYVILDYHKNAFQSYDSLIAEYENDTKILKVYPLFDYSRTTMKYFRHYLEEYVTYGYADDIITTLKKMRKEDLRVFYLFDYIIILVED